MQYYNKITGELQSTPPWGTSFIHPDIKEAYKDWEEVSNDFTPPSKPRTIKQKASEIDDIYLPKLEALLKAKEKAEILGNPTNHIAAKYTAMVAEYKADLQDGIK